MVEYLVVSVAQVGPRVDLRPQLTSERAAFLRLLGELHHGDWALPTGCPGWTVRDIAAHVLHDDLRRLSRMRDGHEAGPRPDPGESLASFIDRTNQRWVAESAFLSPAVLIELLSATSPSVAAMWAATDLAAPGASVSWAGVDPAPRWLDAAREYTEMWTHQQQIREATGRPGLRDRASMDAVSDVLLRALPHTYRDQTAAVGTVVEVSVTGQADVTRWLVAGPEGWTLVAEGRRRSSAAVSIDADTLWRLATGGTSRHEAARRTQMSGDPDLAAQFLDIVAVVRQPPVRT